MRYRRSGLHGDDLVSECRAQIAETRPHKCAAVPAGSYLRLMDFVYHSTLSLRVTEKKKNIKTGFDLEEFDGAPLLKEDRVVQHRQPHHRTVLRWG